MGFHSMLIVQGFFAMSGYLNMNSYARHPNWRSFAIKRIRRIYPAYAITIGFCFFVGMALTTFPLPDFLTSFQTWKYVVCNMLFLNFLEPGLPGVFASHVYPVMDASLWTMKIEVMYYLTVPFVWWMMRKWGTTQVLSLVVALSVVYGVLTRELYEATHVPLFNAMNHQVVGEMALFYFPVLLLCHRSWLQRWQRPLMLLAVLLLALSVYNFRWAYFAPFYMGLLLIGLGYALAPWAKAARWQNITYEFFLLHFPVLQVIMALCPTMSIGQMGIVAFVVTIVLSCGLKTLVDGLSNAR